MSQKHERAKLVCIDLFTVTMLVVSSELDFVKLVGISGIWRSFQFQESRSSSICCGKAKLVSCYATTPSLIAISWLVRNKPFEALLMNPSYTILSNRSRNMNSAQTSYHERSRHAKRSNGNARSIAMPHKLIPFLPVPLFLVGDDDGPLLVELGSPYVLLPSGVLL